MSDLNHARVTGLALAQSWGLGINEFNQLWQTIVPAAIDYGKSSDERD
jgi:hypothetical protein